MNLLQRSFYSQPAVTLAPALLGTVITRRVDGTERRARIVEVEAYLRPRDLASHSSRGRTARTEALFGRPGHAYVYLIYGLHYLLNVVAGSEGGGEAILFRSSEPLDGWQENLTGPGRLARAFAISRRDNGLDFTGSDIKIHHDVDYRPRIIRRSRVGIDYAKHWQRRLLRFIDANSPVALKVK